MEDENTDVFIYQKQDSNETQYATLDKALMDGCEASNCLKNNDPSKTKREIGSGKFCSLKMNECNWISHHKYHMQNVNYPISQINFNQRISKN